MYTPFHWQKTHLYRITENTSSYLDRQPGAALDFFFSYYKMILATVGKKEEEKNMNS